MNVYTKLHNIETAWRDYKIYLENKYPVPDGMKFKLECPHHQRIDRILNVSIEDEEVAKLKYKLDMIKSVIDDSAYYISDTSKRREIDRLLRSGVDIS